MLRRNFCLLLAAAPVLPGIVLPGLSGLAAAAPVPPDPDGWQRILEGKLATVDVHERVYEEAGAREFYIAVRIVNRAAGPIGVDLRNFHRVIYPNQWGLHDAARRGVIDERRAQIPLVDAPTRQALLAAFGKGELTRIESGKSVVYYRAFHGTQHPPRDAAKGKFLIVSLDGELLATDGATVTQLAFEQHDLGAAADLVLPAPVRWTKLPAGALVVADKK